MIPEQKERLKSSFAIVKMQADDVAALFYDRLFELEPSVKHLFKHDMRVQGQKLIQVIDAALASIDEIEKIVPVLWKLGKKHAMDYGVKDSHYDTVGAALLWALEKSLGDVFTPETKAAWTDIYELMSTTMKQAGAEGRTEAAVFSQ